MRWFSFSACLFFSVIWLTLSVAAPALAQTPATLQSSAYRQALEKETFELVNQYRQANQLPPLRWDDTIAKVSRGHSKEMADAEVDFGHDGFSDRIDKLRKAIHDLNLIGAGENVLRTDDPEEVARTAVKLWLNSPHHLKNIRGDYNYSGMGVWVDDKGMIYFTQFFLKLEPLKTVADAQAPPPVKTSLDWLAAPTTVKTSH